jgi:hypothetical protein
MVSRRLAPGIAVLACGLLFRSACAETLPLPASLIDFVSEAGSQLLIRSVAREAYWPLSIQFVTQRDQSYCGVATLVMVLNALHVAAPATPGIEPFTTFTQDNVLNGKTDKILTQAVLADNGMTLDEFGALIETFGVKAEVFHADQSSPVAFRSVAAKYLATRSHYVVVNYLRSALGQERGGHISALAAYDEGTDRFLVLDVSRYKYPPVWVKAADLYSAMDTIDADNKGRRRGFVLIRKDT